MAIEIAETCLMKSDVLRDSPVADIVRKADSNAVTTCVCRNLICVTERMTVGTDPMKPRPFALTSIVTHFDDSIAIIIAACPGIKCATA